MRYWIFVYGQNSVPFVFGGFNDMKGVDEFLNEIRVHGVRSKGIIFMPQESTTACVVKSSVVDLPYPLFYSNGDHLISVRDSSAGMEMLHGA